MKRRRNAGDVIGVVIETATNCLDMTDTEATRDHTRQKMRFQTASKLSALEDDQVEAAEDGTDAIDDELEILHDDAAAVAAMVRCSWHTIGVGASSRGSYEWTLPLLVVAAVVEALAESPVLPVRVVSDAIAAAIFDASLDGDLVPSWSISWASS